MKFTKMQGIGNDFILINAIEENLADDYTGLSQQLCNRNFGIGADGIMLVLPSDIADIKMRIINSDGSEPEMCGNGIRCFARFVYEQGIVNKTSMTVETLAGIMGPEILLDDQGTITGVKVDMGEPILERGDIPMTGQGDRVVYEPIMVDQEEFRVTAVSMGNPHCVIFVEEMAETDVTHWGAKIEVCDHFPRKTNVEFAQVVNEQEIIMRVWERGAGITLACGTGACATLVAANLNGKTGRQATVKLLGGDLHIEWAENNRIYMTGAADNVFTGEIQID